MPKSKHRKNQKQKSRARTERIKVEQRRAQKMFQEEFIKEMEKIRDRQMEIEEVEVKENSNNQ
jgi:predicted membrane protein